MKRFIGLFVAMAVIALVCIFSIGFSQGQSELANQHKIVHRLQGDGDVGKNQDAHPAQPGNAKPSGNNGIAYHGGPVILGGTNVYYIWYGNWSGNSATNILTDLAGNICPSPYFNINTTYYDGSSTPVTNLVPYAGSTTDSHTQRTARSDAPTQAI